MKKIFLLMMLFVLTLGCGFPSLSGLIQNSTSGSGLQALPTESPRLPTATEVPAVVSTPEPRTTLTTGEVENEMKQIQQQVIELRGLQPKVSELKRMPPSPLPNWLKTLKTISSRITQRRTQKAMSAS